MAALISDYELEVIAAMPALLRPHSVFFKAGSSEHAQLSARKMAAATAMTLLRHATPEQAAKLAAKLGPGECVLCTRGLACVASWSECGSSSPHRAPVCTPF